MAIRAETSFSLADQLFNRATIKELADSLERVSPGFRTRRFKLRANKAMPDLELKARIGYLADQLKVELPDDYPSAVAIMSEALPKPLDPSLADNDFGEFIWSVFGEYAARHGRSEPHVAISLEFLRELTKRFSAEFAIRPFLKNFPQQTYSFLSQCARDDNYHVRRLASEGSRPYLPWAERVVLPTEQILALLGTLHADTARFVTRSVANNLNDISKIDPGAAMGALASWQRVKKQVPKELDWMTRHALRTLSKSGHRTALEMLGYPHKTKIADCRMTLPDRVSVGDSLRCGLTFTSQRKQRLKLTLTIGFRKASGKLSDKVFALKELEVEKGEEIAVSKTISFKPMTTRVLYPGEHRLELFANGQSIGEQYFLLEE